MTPASPSGRILPRSLAIVAIATALDALLLALALGGPADLARHPRALALLAVWAIGNTVLIVNRPRLRDPARAEPESPLVVLALLTLPFAAAPLAAWGAREGIAMFPAMPALHWMGVGLVAAGLALRAAAMAQLGHRFSPRVAIQHEHVLETGGLYSRVRHPGYLGALNAALGAALAFESALGLVPVVLLLPALTARVRREDRVLENRFGDAFRAWRSRTGGLLPRLLPAREP